MDNLEVMTRVMDEHKVLQEEFDSVGMIMSDKDALLRIAKARTELATDLERPFAERLQLLIKSLTVLENGLKRHYAFEEELLPPLLGELLTKALIVEHESLRADAHRMLSMITAVNGMGSNPGNELHQEAIINEWLRSLREKKLDHQRREEAVLQTLKKICEELANGSS